MTDEWDIRGKTCIVTGANKGIGKATAVELARRGAHVTLAGRSAQRTQPVVDEITREGGEAEFLQLNLASLSEVSKAAAAFRERHGQLHVLINNAGLIGQRELTVDGFEPAFGVNHMGHYVFTRWMIPTLEASGPARIVNVSSSAHSSASGFGWSDLRKSGGGGGFHEYGVSKLANILFTRELAKRLDGSTVTAYALHPGFVATDLVSQAPRAIWRRVLYPLYKALTNKMLSPTEGADTTIWCATAPDLATESGGYYVRRRLTPPSAIAQDDELAAELWQRSEDWASEFIPD